MLLVMRVSRPIFLFFLCHLVVIDIVDLLVDVEAEDVDAAPATRGSKRKPPRHGCPPFQGPRMGIPAQAPSATAGRELVKGDVSQWLQQHHHQQSDPWQVQALSAEATLRDMEQRYARSQEEKRAAGVERDSLKWDTDKLRDDKDRLQAKVNTLEREGRQGSRASGRRRPRDPESPRAPDGGWGEGRGAPNPAGTRFLLAGAQAWHA